MPTVRKTITVTDKQDAWITAQVEAGDFTNDSEYIRDLLRRDQEQKGKFEALRRAIQDGLDSGVSDETLRDVWKDAEARHHAKRG